MTGGQLLNQYLAAIGKDGEDNGSKARLAQGQFHDVVLLGEVAYRFPAMKSPAVSSLHERNC